ncbi:hypothetical protein BC936DRAFT_142475 [Jimgerdemannia flammicorona]|uniref:Uncharacterized protein n=1 Tax=Jimgerdemannia flammicorona TaxID=994334 RepID=A0A433DF40_9FUNG|nr:hypothetical protein BC936DRAFT_142475 [Jimgerdemannia flammicorona]
MNPETDKLLFANRNHFDLIVYYDRNSMSFNTPSGVNGYAYMSPLKNLKIAIYENEFTKSLPRMPVLLVGGFEAWRAFAKDKGVYVFKEDGGSRGGSAENTQKKNVASRGMGGGVVPTTAYVPKMPPPGRANTGLTELPPINRTVTDFFHQQSDGNTVQSMVKPNFGPAAPPITQYNGYQASVPPPAQKMNMPIPQPYRPSSVPQPPLVQLRILSDEPMSIDPATAQRNNTAYPGAVSAGVPASAVGTTAAAGATRLSRRNAFIDNPYNGFTSTASTNTLYEPPPPALAPKPNRPVRPPPPLGVPTSPQSPPIPPKNHVPNIDPNAGARPATGQLPMSPSSFSQLGGIKNGNGMGQNFQVPEEIVEWIKSFRPAHRVRPKIFKSILAHHHVMSVDHILKLKNPKWASHEARHHPLLRKICEENKCSKSERTQLEDLVECAVLVAHGKSANDPQLPSWETDLNLKIEAVCNQILTSEQMKPLIDLGDRLVKATRDLATNPEGIQYNVDKLMGTNKHVFGILGPHTEANNRPFMPTGKPKSDEAIMKFHKSKLHTSCSNWAKAAAADICAQIIETTGKTHISLNDVKSEWLKRESHFVFEAHLPSLIPFSFVDKIIIPKAKDLHGGALGPFTDLQPANTSS